MKPDTERRNFILAPAINAARIAMELDSDVSRNINTAEQVAMAACRLHDIETRRGFDWENQTSDWETVCRKIAVYIGERSRVPTPAMIRGYIKS